MNQDLYNYLARKLLTIFGSQTYLESQSLQQDFQDFKRSNLGQYHRIMDSILQEHPDYQHLTWRDVKINYKRWHVCKCCQQPFIATDTYNRQQICQLETYTRYGKDGYYKSAGKSICYMRNKTNLMKKYRKTS